jgi:type IV pilus assembly protein PilB
MQPIAKQHHSSILSRVKVMAELDIAEKRVPQDGRFKVRMPGKTIDFRVSIMPSVHGEDAVIRILDKESISEKFTELRLDILGFPEQELKRFRKYIREPVRHGAGDGTHRLGKTTTLYAALSEIKTVEDKIVTIETRSSISSTASRRFPINEKKGLTFARGPAVDPAPRPGQDHGGRDRDPETAQIAIQSRSRATWCSPPSTPTTWWTSWAASSTWASSPISSCPRLNCVMAQRLVRLTCSHCKRPVRVDPSCSRNRASTRRWRRRTSSSRAPAAWTAAAAASRGARPSASCSTCPIGSAK